MKAFLLLSISLFCLSSSALFAQKQPEAGCPSCPQYNAFMEQGKAFFEKGIFDKALIEFQAAQVAARICNCNSSTPSEYILKVFKGIQQQKETAITAQKRAEKAEKNTKAALSETEEAKNKAQAALQKADKLIKAFYFYADRFALAYGARNGPNIFYFIDKNGDEVPKLGRWQKAEQFDDRGFAKVKKEGDEGNFLLDTIGKVYPVAYDVNNLGPEMTALDLSGKQLTLIPPEVFQHLQLEVLLLNNNNLDSLPAQIGELKNLTDLNLNSNHLSTLPAQIGALKNLTFLSLSWNNFTNLPAQMEKLKNLADLDLSDNQMTGLQAQIGDLKNLTLLHLSGNLLTSLPAQIGELKNLTYLELAHNPFPDEVLEKTKQLLPNCTIREYDQETSEKYFDEQNYPKAFDYIKNALEKDSANFSGWYDLSFYALFVGKPNEAISAAQKTLELNPEAQNVESNLALGYLLNNQWQESEKIYLKWKGRQFPDNGGQCDEVFLKDIQDLEAAGITHPDFGKVKQLFGK
ncbi:MAG: hypothetical protein ACKVT2_11235 [Saprospiraceae bacterium]